MQLDETQRAWLRDAAVEMTNLAPWVLDGGEQPPEFWSLLDDIVDEIRARDYPLLRRNFAAMSPVANLRTTGDLHGLLFEYDGFRARSRDEILNDWFETFDELIKQFPRLYDYVHGTEGSPFLVEYEVESDGDSDIALPEREARQMNRKRKRIYNRFQTFAAVRDYLKQLADWPGDTSKHGYLVAIPQEGSVVACVDDDGVIYSEKTLFVEAFEGFNINRIRRCVYDTCQNIFLQTRTDQEYCSRTCRDNARAKRYRDRNADSISRRRSKAYKEKCDAERKKS